MPSQHNDSQEPIEMRDAPEPRPQRRPFLEPTLTKHDKVTRITLISDAFGGIGGSGATFF